VDFKVCDGLSEGLSFQNKQRAQGFFEIKRLWKIEKNEIHAPTCLLCALRNLSSGHTRKTFLFRETQAEELTSQKKRFVVG